MTAELKSIPLGMLKKGDKFVASKPSPFMGVAICSGVADMDGHLVSESYGFRTGNNHYLEASKNYINVRFDGEVYGENWEHPNDTLKQRDGWTIWVTSEVRLRVDQDVLYNADLAKVTAAKSQEEKEEADRAVKKLDLLNQIAKLKRQVEAL